MSEDESEEDSPERAPQSLEVIQAVDETVKWLAGRMGVILLENYENHDCVAALPFYSYDEGEKEVGLIFQKDKIMRNAIISVLLGLEKLAETGAVISFMPYEDGLALIRENVELRDDEE